MKYLYLVDYWIPFPASEYGGTLSVIGENDNEVHDLLLDWRDEYNSQHDSRIMERVVNAHKFALVDEETSRIVDTFTT
jgi:hypothetical protein